VSALLILLFLSLYPLWFMLQTSTRSPSQVSEDYFKPTVSDDASQNYRTAAEIVLPLVKNSVVVSLGALVITLVLSGLAAYVFTWRKFPGREQLFLLVVATMMVPAVLTFVPTYILVRDLDLLGTPWALILPFAAQSIGFTTFLLRAFFQALPLGVVEAARIDGAAEWRVATSIVLPMTMPAFGTVSIINVLVTWNQFLWPLVTASAERQRTIPVGLAFLQTESGSALPTLMAGFVLAALPLVAVFAVMTRPFIAGLTSGALRG
jgi:ABC-type glycerol-3-phosphate transport system permease component